MHIYSTVSISRSSLLQQRKWTTIYVTVLHKLQKKKSLNISALHIFFGKEWPNYCYRMARAMFFLQRLLLLFMLCSDQVSETSWCYDVDHPGELMQRWKQPSSSSSSLLTNVVMEPEVSSGRIDHVSH